MIDTSCSRAKLFTMKLAPADIAYIYDRFVDLTEKLQAIQDSAPQPLGDDDNPTALLQEMSRLTGVLRNANDADPERRLEVRELQTLVEFGIQLIIDLAALASHLEAPELAREIENLSLPLGLWFARQGGELTRLEPIVNALAFQANHQKDPQGMAELYRQVCEIIDAVSPVISEDADKNNPLRPWRLLLLNRAIVATRSLHNDMMEPAFDAIVELLPDDANRFFEEGMEQMDAIGYPEHVREIMSRYYLMHAKQRVLH